MQKAVLTCCLLAVLLGLPIISVADAGDGEFLGFKIGKKCAERLDGITVTEGADALTFALRPSYAGADVPDEFEIVNLECSKTSFTTGAIKAYTRIRSTETAGQKASAVIEAGAIAEKYKAILADRYPDWNDVPEESWSNKLEVTDGQYVLYVRVYSQKAEPSFLESLMGDGAREATVIIGLRYLDGTKAQQDWAALTAQEAGQRNDAEGM